MCAVLYEGALSYPATRADGADNTTELSSVLASRMSTADLNGYTKALQNENAADPSNYCIESYAPVARSN